MTSGTDSSWPDRATLRTILMIAAVVMAGWAIYDHVIAPIVLDTVDRGGLANRLGVHLLLVTPIIFYVTGLWQLSQFLRPDGATKARLAAISSSFLYGAIADVIIVPTLLRWIALRGGFDVSVNGAAVVVVGALALCLPFFSTSTRNS